ncbi:MAG TPA: MaoC family dehydratase [Pirellulaceae bacterium]|nr:MaoC family dehydratase [Pirellulaceae bacterium]HMO94020.1 MaoC family dehydratase [Pirellulaceae bacterium]HMP70781.1 MaoC family dehydratase [Pirellulaceae bacterium]
MQDRGEIYLEDLSVGQVFASGSHTFVQHEMIEFAQQFDPQDFHLDPARAVDTFFGRLCASGWHTAAVTMRLFVTGELRIAGGLVGAGVEQLRWSVPTYPGDTVTVSATILEVRQMRSKPEFGIVKAQIIATNQHGEIAQQMIANLVVPRRRVDAPSPSPACKA